MYLIVKSNPEKVKEILKTNRDYKIGDTIKGDLIAMSKIANQNKDIFEIGGVEKKEPKISKPRGKSKQRKKFGPKQDKMLDIKSKEK